MTASFAAESKRYCVIPVTSRKGDEGDYTLTLQFQVEEKFVKFGKKFETSSHVSQVPSKEAIDKARKDGQLGQQVNTPYNMDFVNKRDNSKPNKNKDSIIENVRLALTSDIIFEDEAIGMSKKILTNQEFSEVDQAAKEQIMMGVDLDELDQAESRKNMSEQRKRNLKEIQEEVKHEVQDVLDLSYYHLGNDGLQAIIPHLEYEYFLNTRVLDVSYNSLTDAGLEPLVLSLAQLGSPLEELNISGNDITDSIINLISENIRNGRCKRLGNVVVEDCRKVTADGHRILKIAQMKVSSAGAPTKKEVE